MSTHPRPPWHRALVLGTALSLAAVLAACGGDDDASSTDGGGGGSSDGLVIAIADEPSTLDPRPRRTATSGP
jgi:ABC-type oligopeptide transport system substrate-binding subunit